RAPGAPGQQQGWPGHHGCAEGGLARGNRAPVCLANAACAESDLDHEQTARLPAAGVSAAAVPDARTKLPLLPHLFELLDRSDPYPRGGARQPAGAAPGMPLPSVQRWRGRPGAARAWQEFNHNRLRLQPLLTNTSMDINKRTILWIVFAVSL